MYYMRPMLASDLPAVATLSAHAYLEEEVYGPIWSHRESEPAVFPAWREWHLRMAKNAFNIKGGQCWVMCCRDTAKQSGRQAAAASGNRSPAQTNDEQVVALAVWERCGASQTARAWDQTNSSWYHAIERQLLSWEYTAAELLRIYGRAYNRRLCAAFDDLCGDAWDKWADAYPERWHLSNMAVDPTHAGRGIGKRLLQWGLDHARAEGVPVTLFASFAGRKLYDKQGFRAFDWPNRDRRIHGDQTVSPYMIWEADKFEDDCPL